jgi:hypothetical protein
MAVQLPVARGISVDTTGAEIIAEDSPAVSRPCQVICRIGLRDEPELMMVNDCWQTRDARGIYLPAYRELLSHVAIDVSRYA